MDASQRSFRSDTVCVILAAGQGTRMQSATMHKVCFPIAGKPAINRTIETLKAAGIRRFIVVVGAMAGQVVETIGREHPEVAFVFQSEQLGTGHATQIAIRVLEQAEFKGNVLLALGDKVFETSVVQELAELFMRSRADLVFATAPKTGGVSLGRIVEDETGRVLGNIEHRDIQRSRALCEMLQSLPAKGSISTSRLLDAALKHIPAQKKLLKALGVVGDMLMSSKKIAATELRQIIEKSDPLIKVAGRAMTADELEAASPTVNVSLYLYRAESLYESLAQVEAKNAQGELYLTDTIAHLANARDPQGEPLYRVRPLKLGDPDDVMGFNSPDELLYIEEVLRRRFAEMRHEVVTRPRLADNVCKPVGKWMEIFSAMPAELRGQLATFYGDDAAAIEERRKSFLAVLRKFGERYGAERDVIIARAPGRVNLMGRHVDHRGGYVNVMAINREVIMVAASRDDDVVRMTNTDSEHFPDKEFRISELLGSMEWEDWLSYVNSRHVQQLVLNSRGDWSNYVKAAVLRLQQDNHSVRVLGMDCAFTGNVPMAAGLSSSSALVVASAEAAVELNRFDLTAQQFVDLCGEGEWFVGSRGGSADHAAIRLGRRGSVAHVGFFPFRADKLVQFPDDLAVVIANSHIKAAKSAGARDQFNSKVACYEFGFMLLQDRHPQYLHLMEHVRDIAPDRLGVKPSAIYEMLKSVPEPLTRKQIKTMLAERHRDKVERIFSSHAEPDAYWVRSVLAYGVGETARSAVFADLLQAGDVGRIGSFMRVSHDGDRVSRTDEGGRRAPYAWQVTDSALESRIQDLRSEAVERVNAAQLWMMPGGYACSTPEIDGMVDAALGVEGVIGAQLAGAGLGGCIMVLTDKDKTDLLMRALTERYYEPAGLEPAMTVCVPVEGSGLISV
ncbi:MAG TPA: galactokinase family protein [Candidatus Brocadiia bacterium]|nr:galactokinase family protein [Candidatus Brocadiia bacterium]